MFIIVRSLAKGLFGRLSVVARLQRSDGNLYSRCLVVLSESVFRTHRDLYYWPAGRTSPARCWSKVLHAISSTSRRFYTLAHRSLFSASHV